jgi:hypothetical protein
MKLTKYIGTFVASNGHTYTLEVNCNGFIQAFILLTADAIRSAKHYQLDNIVDENDNKRKIDDIKYLTKLFLYNEKICSIREHRNRTKILDYEYRK